MSNQKIYRERTIYISSTDVPDNENAGRVDLYFREPIIPDPGYSLNYGIRSIGFNTSATNISDTQRNNTIFFRVSYVLSAFIKHATLDYYIPRVNGPGTTITIDIPILVPDALYTLEHLFEYLSNSTETNFVIPTGFYVDDILSHDDLNNIIPFNFDWRETLSGYTIFPRTNTKDVQAHYPTVNPAVLVTSVQVSNRLSRIQILPRFIDTDPRSLLFDLLFTSVTSSSKDTPGCIPPWTRATGKNPHDGLDWTVAANSDIDIADDTFKPFSIMISSVKEIGNEALYDQHENKIPNQNLQYYNSPYQVFFKPKLLPIYIEILTSLPNLNVADGTISRNLLLREFFLGGKDGNQSFFHEYNPVWNSLEGVSSISQISILFASEGDRLNFFNLEFALSIGVGETLVHEEIQEVPLTSLGQPDGVTSLIEEALLKRRRDR